MAARVTRAVPPGVRYPVAGLGGALWWAADFGRRHNARVNYGAVLGLPEDHPEVRRLAKRAFENYTRMLADFLLMGSLEREEVREIVKLEGHEHADAAVAGGRGAILALPHMGSWDFAGSMAAVHGYHVAAVAESFPGSLNDAVVKTRSRHGLQVIPLNRSSVRSIYEFLDENGMVALLCDVPHGPGTEVRFFDRRALVPSGPAAIACRRGAPILPVYSRRLEGLKYEIHVDPPIQPPATDRCRGKEAVTDLMQQVIDRFQSFIRLHPDQWYAFRRILN